MLHIYNYSVIISKHKTKIVAGTFDDGFGSDFLHMFCQNSKIKLICLSHASHLYQSKTEYLYNPFDYYITTCTFHTQIIKEATFLSNNCKYLDIGYPSHTISKIKMYQDKRVEKEFDIIFICNYYQNISINPLTPYNTKMVAKCLLELLKKGYKIAVRPRSKDKYYEDLHSILGDNVKFCIEDDRVDIYEDIKRSKLGIGIISNGIRDGLLMGIPFIHLNLSNLKTTFLNEIEDNHLYYADSKESLLSAVDDFFNNKLKPLEFVKNNKKYIRDGLFEKEMLQEIIKKELLCAE